MTDLTGANAVFTLTITALFPTPVQLQGFAADDIFDTEPLDSVETQMGVDGQLSGGFVFKEVMQSIALQADSVSNQVFDNWWAAMQSSQAVFVANGVVVLPNVKQKWALTRGFLTRYQPIPNVKKLLQARRHQITWNLVSPATT